MSGLAGRTVVNTRAAHQADALDTLLRERGATPLAYPCIELALANETSPLDDALVELADGGYDWLVVTSTNTALVIGRRLQALGLSLPSLRVAAVGPATANAVQAQLGLTAAAMPDDYTGVHLADALGPVAGQRVLLPKSALAEDQLADLLTDSGAQVTRVEAYTMRLGTGGVALLPLLREQRVDAITLTSGSTARHLVDRLAQEGGSAADLDGVILACIGPRTADAAQALGLAVAVTPATYTLDGLVDALDAHLAVRTP